MRLAPALAALALTTALTPASAQTSLSVTSALPQTGNAGPQRPLTAAAPAMPSVADPAPGRSRPLSAASRVVESRRQLPLGADEWRLGGEISTRLAPIYLVPTEAARPAKLKVSYLNAVSVMPEASRLTVMVNNTVIGERYVQAATKPETLSFDVPTGLLQAGYNAIRITARHVHRVDCSREASYELWSQILPDQSGLVFAAANAEIRDLRDLPAVRPTKSGTTRIRARTSPGLDPESLQRVSRAVQAAVLVGRFTKPEVEIDPEESGEPGLDLVVGTESVVENLTGSKPAGSGPRVQLSHDVQTDRVLLVVTGSTKEEIDTALQRFEGMAASQATPPGSAAGLQALGADLGARVEGGETIPLAALGFETQRFSGRYYRQSGVIQMPADLYPGDYGRVTLGLNAAYGANLAPTSKINVRVNGVLVSSVPLARDSGGTLNARSAFLPLSAFKPGANSIDIEADTATPSDKECNATSQLDQRDRLLLASTSEISVPRLARIATLPSLSSIPAGGLVGLAKGEPMQLHLPNPSPETIKAALALITKITAVSRQPAPVTFTFEQVSSGSPHVVTIGALSDVSPATLASAGLSLDGLRRAWQGATPVEPRIEAKAAPIRVAAAGPDIILHAQAMPAPEKREAGAALDLPGSRQIEPAPAGERKDELTENARGWMATARAWVEENLRRVYKIDIARKDLNAPDAYPDIATSSSTLVISQRAAPKELQTGWQTRLIPEVASSTVIVAPTAELLQASMTEVLASDLWQQFSGGTAAYDRTEAALRTVAGGETWFIPTQPLSPGNVRLIVAGWLSQNVLFYLSVLIGVVVLLASVTNRLVRLSGVRQS